MKKTICILSIIFATSLSAFAYLQVSSDEAYSNIFISRFLQCIPCSNTQKLEDGEQVIYDIRGWEKDKCRFAISSSDEKYLCRFTRAQVNEYYEAMKLDHNNKEGAKTLLEKYINDSGTCEKN